MSTRKELFNENIIACQKCERLMKYAKETSKNGRKKEFLEDFKLLPPSECKTFPGGIEYQYALEDFNESFTPSDISCSDFSDFLTFS